jgi:excisionase family DNA binding protein
MAKLMTIGEVADYLRVTKKTIYRLLRQGKIPATKVGNQWRFAQDSINEWLKQKSVKAKANILVVDDEEAVRLLFAATLKELGHGVVAVETAAEGLELVKEQDFKLVFLDLKMPGMDGAELFHQIKLVKPRLPVIIITGYPNSEMMVRALSYGPFGVMNKPFGEADIINAVNSFLGIISS